MSVNNYRLNYFLKFIGFVLLLVPITHIRAAFFHADVSARSVGMAGAFVAVADDTASVFWNPAGLSQIDRYELATTRVHYPVGAFSTEMLATTIPNLFYGTASLAVLQNGEPDLYREQILQVTYGYDLSTQLNLPLSIGVNLRRLSVAYLGADRQDPLFADGIRKSFYPLPTIGLLYWPFPNLKLALVQENLRPLRISFNPSDKDYNHLNRTFRMGLAWTSNHTTLTAEITSEKLSSTSGNRPLILRVITSNSTQVKAGVEHWIRLNRIDSEIAVRVGRMLGNYGASSWNIGAGYRLAVSYLFALQLDYAFSYTPKSQIGNYHRWSLLIAR